VGAGYEGHGERTDLLPFVGLDDDSLSLQAVETHDVGHRRPAVDRAAVAFGDCRHIEGVVKVGVSDQHGIG
jgi:hypothetical protein